MSPLNLTDSLIILSSTVWSFAKIELMFLPPYSPNLNPIERYWKFFKKKVMNKNQIAEKRMAEIMDLALKTASSPREILDKLRELDRGE